MEEYAPLASLSLTHVHYVNILPSPSATSGLLTPAEPRRPHFLHLRMARPRAAGPLRNIRNVDMVEP
jgi:hypothetical protein